MILKGGQRGSGTQLAQHLLNTAENDHVDVHELRGFLADDLAGAFAEIDAVALGTKAKQPFFSVSINPPAEGSAQLTDKDFRSAARKIERAHGLNGQPRAIVFHEKDGRRHAHVVWSRIDAQTMTAKNLPHFKRKLMTISHALFLEHGFDLPDGFKDNKSASLDRVTLIEWQADKRRGRNAIDQKQLIRQCWQASDNKTAFSAALAEHGYALARGDRRGHVVVNADGQVIAVARAVGVKTKDVRGKLGEADNLPTVTQAQKQLAEHIAARFEQAASEVRANFAKKRAALEAKRTDMIAAHRQAREKLTSAQAKRRAQAHASLTRTGLAGLWDRLVRSYDNKLKRVAMDARLTSEDQAELQALRREQLSERRVLEAERTALRREAFGLIDEMRADHNELFAKVSADAPTPNGPRADPRQVFVAQDSAGPVTDIQIQARPVRVLERLSYFKASFTEREVSRELTKIMPDMARALEAKRQVLTSADLVRVDGRPKRYTTQSYVEADQALQKSSRSQVISRHNTPSTAQLRASFAAQNKHM